MRKIKIDLKFLQDNRACTEGQTRFAKRWPKGITISEDPLQIFNVFAPYFGEPGIVYGGDEDVDEDDVEGDLYWLYKAIRNGGGYRFGEWDTNRSQGIGFQTAGFVWLACCILADQVAVYVEAQR